MSTLMKKSEVCEYLRISLDTLDSMIKRGELEVIQVGRQWRISADAIEAYLNRNRSKQPEA